MHCQPIFWMLSAPLRPLVTQTRVAMLAGLLGLGSWEQPQLAPRDLAAAAAMAAQ